MSKIEEIESKITYTEIKKKDSYNLIYRYDKIGNLLSYENTNGFKEWKDYDESGNVIYYESSNGFSFEKTYDKMGNISFYIDSNGFEYSPKPTIEFDQERKEKDIWIQKAKALLFDISQLDEYKTFRKEAEVLLEESGGYNPFEETSSSELRWK